MFAQVRNVLLYSKMKSNLETDQRSRERAECRLGFYEGASNEHIVVAVENTHTLKPGRLRAELLVPPDGEQCL